MHDSKKQEQYSFPEREKSKDISFLRRRYKNKITLAKSIA
jgi:hypothetical protein